MTSPFHPHAAFWGSTTCSSRGERPWRVACACGYLEVVSPVGFDSERLSEVLRGLIQTHERQELRAEDMVCRVAIDVPSDDVEWFKAMRHCVSRFGDAGFVEELLIACEKFLIEDTATAPLGKLVEDCNRRLGSWSRVE